MKRTIAILVATLLGAPFASQPAAAAPRPPKPNIIVILADDMGYGDSSAYGGWIKTPQLERLAAEGLRFTDFHSSGNVCSPTRAGLLTGRYQQRAGIPGVVYANAQEPAYFSGLQPTEVTLAKLLHGAGYATALYGKWHLGYFPKYNPLNHGFDDFRGYVSGNVDYHSHQDNQGRNDWWNGRQKEPESGYTTHLITKHAEDFIRRHRQEPFFLYLAHEAVHEPYQGPRDLPQRGPGTVKGKAARPVKDAYRDMMTEMDSSIGVVISLLRETGLADNTLVFFFSDNGATKAGSNGPLRGFKGTNWEGGHREPAIAWWPGHIKPRVSDQLAISLDVMPTLLDLAGIAAPADRKLDGASLKSLLLENQPLAVRQLFWNGAAMRDGPWKLMLQQGKPQLFNLAEDLGEAHDLAAQHPERVQLMLTALNHWKVDVATGATPQPASAAEMK